MSAVDTLFLITAALLAVVGTILFVVGLIKKTPLKWVFLVIIALGIIGKAVLPKGVYKQAKEEGIIWLTVLHCGDIEAARKEHEEGVNATNGLLDKWSNRTDEIPTYVNED